MLASGNKNLIQSECAFMNLKNNNQAQIKKIKKIRARINEMDIEEKKEKTIRTEQLYEKSKSMNY